MFSILTLLQEKTYVIFLNHVHKKYTMINAHYIWVKTLPRGQMFIHIYIYI